MSKGELNINKKKDFSKGKEKDGSLAKEGGDAKSEEELEKESEIEKELEILKKEKDEFENLLKRERAEFDNYRKRIQEEKIDLIKYGGEEFLGSFLAIIDTFSKALLTKSDDETVNSFLKGFVFIKKQMDDLLENNGVRISTQIDDEFNPSLHQAVQSVPGKGDRDIVLEIYQDGYFYHEKVLREAMVKIAKKATIQEEVGDKRSKEKEIKEEFEKDDESLKDFKKN